jgi:hypothetical protein
MGDNSKEARFARQRASFLEHKSRIQREQDRVAHIEEFRNSIANEPLPENVVPIFKPGIETNGYKA